MREVIHIDLPIILNRSRLDCGSPIRVVIFHFHRTRLRIKIIGGEGKEKASVVELMNIQALLGHSTINTTDGKGGGAVVGGGSGLQGKKQDLISLCALCMC